MLIQVGFQSKSFTTSTTHVRFSVGVRLNMCP